jgi:hypothetical protein
MAIENFKMVRFQADGVFPIPIDFGFFPNQVWVINKSQWLNTNGKEFLYYWDSSMADASVLQLSTGATPGVIASTISSNGITPYYDGTIVGAGIVDITVANPGVVESYNHGFQTNDQVVITDVNGMTEINGQTVTVTRVDRNHYSIVDTSTYTAYVSGGSAYVVGQPQTVTSRMGILIGSDLAFADNDLVTVIGIQASEFINIGDLALI